MSANPYQSPNETDVLASDLDADKAEPKTRTLRLWILPTGLTGVAIGFGFSIFLLANFAALRELANIVLAGCVVAAGLSCLWGGDWLFESRGKR